MRVTCHGLSSPGHDPGVGLPPSNCSVNPQVNRPSNTRDGQSALSLCRHCVCLTSFAGNLIVVHREIRWKLVSFLLPSSNV